MSTTLRLSAALLASLALLLAACAPAAPPAPAASSPSAPARPQAAPAPAVTPTPAGPRYGGTIKVLMGAEPACLDTYKCSNAQSYQAPAYNLLVQYDSNEGRTIVPDLAESWQVSPDGRAYTFKVRQGVKFHDGTPWTAEDVYFNLDRIVHPLKGDVAQMAWALTPATDKIERVDDSTVRVQLKFPFAPFLALLAFDYHPMYSQTYVSKGDPGKSPMGTGPFRYESFTVGVGAKLVKNSDYWDKKLPYLDGIQYILVKDPATRKAAVRTRSVDMTGRMFEVFSPSEVKDIQKDAPEVVFKAVNSAMGPWLFLNTAKEPFTDPRVRQAVHLAIDRDAAIKVVADGDGLLGGYFSNIPGWGLTEKELRQLPGFGNKDAEREQAKKLLAEAGYSKGLTLTILSRNIAVLQRASVFVTGQLQPLDITAKIEVVEDSAFWPRVRRGDFQAMVIPPSNIAGDLVTQGRFFVPGGSLNFTAYKDPQITETWEKQTRELDTAKRKELVRQLDKYMFQQYVPSIPLVWPRAFVAYWPNVRGVVLPVTDYAGERLDRVWLGP